jgi:hypothetical protein
VEEHGAALVDRGQPEANNLVYTIMHGLVQLLWGVSCHYHYYVVRGGTSSVQE